MSKLSEVLGQLIKTQEEDYPIIGVVTSVDEGERTCEVEPANGDADILGVNLQANIEFDNGVVKIPAIESEVIVSFLTKESGYVSLFTELSKIIVDIGGQTLELTESGWVFNAGSNGGLININELKTQIDKNSSAISALLLTFNSWVVVPADGGAALKAVAIAQLAGKSTANLANIEDKKVTH